MLKRALFGIFCEVSTCTKERCPPIRGHVIYLVCYIKKLLEPEFGVRLAGLSAIKCSTVLPTGG